MSTAPGAWTAMQEFSKRAIVDGMEVKVPVHVCVALAGQMPVDVELDPGVERVIDCAEQLPPISGVPGAPGPVLDHRLADVAGVTVVLVPDQELVFVVHPPVALLARTRRPVVHQPLHCRAPPPTGDDRLPGVRVARAAVGVVLERCADGVRPGPDSWARPEGKKMAVKTSNQHHIGPF